MTSLKRFYKQMGVYWTLLISNLLPSILCLLFVLLFLLPLIKNTARSNDDAYEQLLLASAASQFQEAQNAADTIVNKIERSEWIHPLFIDRLKELELPYATKNEIASDLSLFAAQEQDVVSVSFCFYQDAEFLYSNFGVYHELEFYREHYPDSIKYQFMPVEADSSHFTSLTLDDTEFLVYRIPFRDIPEGVCKGDINIVFSAEKLANRMAAAADGHALAFRLLDAQGECLWSHTMDGDTAVQTVPLSVQVNPDGDILEMEIPLSIHNRTSASVMPLLSLIVVVALALCLVSAFLLSRASYTPLSDLISRISGKILQTNDSFEALDHTINTILQKRAAMSDALDTLRPLARQRILGRLLDGTVSLSERTADQFLDCELRFDYGKFNVVSVTAPFSSLCTEQDYGTLASELAMEVLLGHCAASVPVQSYLYYKDDDSYQIIVNYEDDHEFQNYVESLSKNCRQFFQKRNLEQDIHVSAGQPVRSVNELYRSAEQADSAIHMASLNRASRTVFYNEVEPYLKADYRYSLAEEILLSRSIVDGNEEAAKDLLYSILEQNREQIGRNHQALWLLYLDLYFTVSHSSQSLGIGSLPRPTQTDIDICLNDVDTWIGAMISSICNQIRFSKKVNLNSMEIKVLDYIEDNMFDPNLSLNSIAEAFCKSTTWVSAFVKEQKGINYNAYINQTRIQRALELIEKEGLDINTVYARVGYVSLSTFRRNYNKYANSAQEETEDTL